jgi:hypothetical protein
MFEFNALTFSIIVFLSAIIPGGLLGMFLLRKSNLNLTEKLLCSFFLGMFMVPTLLFLEGMVGIPFSFNSVLVNLLVLVAAGILAWGYLAFKGEFKLELPNFNITWEMLIPVFLLLALFLAFWIRIQPFSPIYSELDPYWYVYGTGQLVQTGYEVKYDDTAWWPEMNSTHMGLPLKKYLEAGWYTLYTQGGQYNNYLLFVTSSWLPPISAAMLCFGAYLLVSTLYGRKYGVFAAFLLAVLPISIFKMSAGVNEASPISMGLLFLSLGAFAYSLMKKDKAMYLFTAFIFFVTAASSTYTGVLVLPVFTLLIVQSVDYFLRGKPNFDFIEACSYAYVGLLLSVAIQAVQYSYGISAFISGPIMLATIGMIVALLCYFVPLKFALTDKKRLQVLGVVIVISLAAYFFTPFGNVIRGEVRSYVGNVDFNTALEKTIAEQNLAGDSFEGEAGFLAYVPELHKGDWLYYPLAGISSGFTAISNLAFKTLDVVFNVFVGVKQTTSPKQDSILFVFLVLAIIGLAVRHFSRKDDEREIPSTMLLILAVLLPVFYVGMNKIKFTVFAGIAIAIVAPIAIAECERFFAWVFRKKETVVEVPQSDYYYTMRRHKKQDAPKKPPLDFGQYVSPVFICLIVAISCMQVSGPAPYGYVLLLKSFEPRYQDNPIANAPITLQLCTDLKAKGVPENQIQMLCEAGKSPEIFANTTNGQFNYDVCWLSQMTVDELIPGNSTDAQQRSAEASTSARFRCNRIPGYWISSMEWMKDNLNSSDRITSWWDYGHWTNYLGNTNTVLRNEHASKGMIGRVAHDFLIGTTQDLIDSMNYFDSEYVLFDVEIIGGNPFGGKYGALNYLGCVHEGATSLDETPGTSDCEFEHSPERIVISPSYGACVISESQQLTGTPAYQMMKNGPSSTPVYCVGTVTIATGDKITATYYYDKRDANGDLILSKGFVRSIQTEGDVVLAEMVYTTDGVWIENNALVSGMDDVKNEFYKSNLYTGFYLKSLPGFDLVYDMNEIKIYRLKNFIGNKEGYIDPIESKKRN